MKTLVLKPRIKRVLVGCAIMILSSCSQCYYAPTNHNVLLFEKEGDVTLYGGVGFQSKFGGIGFAYNDHLGFVSSFRSFTPYNPIAGFNKVQTFLFENEVVLYKKQKKGLSPSLNIAYGYGELDRNNKDYSLKLHRVSLMPSIWYSTPYFQIALSSRFSGVMYDLEDESKGTVDLNSEYNISDLDNGMFTFVEPGVTVAVGFKQFKVRMQHLFIFKLTDYIGLPNPGYINFKETTSSITLCYQFNNKK